MKLWIYQNSLQKASKTALFKYYMLYEELHNWTTTGLYKNLVIVHCNINWINRMIWNAQKHPIWSIMLLWINQSRQIQFENICTIYKYIGTYSNQSPISWIDESFEVTKDHCTDFASNGICQNEDTFNYRNFANVNN